MGYVLVVDDDEMIRDLLDVVLTEEGYEVNCARSVAQALTLVQSRQPNVILFDLSLTDGEGAEFVIRYRELPCATARLIVVSGRSNLSDEATRIGADGFVVKPFAIDDLLATVVRVLG